MYKVKESDYRALEMIEESVMKKVFQTKKTCPRHLLYLEAGMIPARYQVERQVLNFLQYLLQQDKNSLIFRIFSAMKDNPTNGDWASFAISLVKKYNINLTLYEIEKMKTSSFKKLVKQKVKEIAFLKLTQRQQEGEKGKTIVYNSLGMADYLQPESKLTVREKIEMFALRCQMNENPFNFGEHINCQMGCSQLQENEHILNCPLLNEHEDQMNIEDIRNGSLNRKIEVLRRFNENNNRMKQHLRDSVDTVNPL